MATGKRYLLGPLYVLMGDTAGALRSFAWFAQTFPDDSGEPLHFLRWTLALYRADQLEEAAAKLCQTMLSNVYLIPRSLRVYPETTRAKRPHFSANERLPDSSRRAHTWRRQRRPASRLPRL
jgi:hypothetical protein